MTSAKNTQIAVSLVELLLASGLATFSLHTGNDPLQIAVGTAALTMVGNIGINWSSNLLQEAYRNLTAVLTTPSDAKNQPLASALTASFVEAIRQVSKEWQAQPHYYYLERSNRDEAERTSAFFKLISRHATNYFQAPSRLGRTLERKPIVAVQGQDAEQILNLRTDLIQQHLLGYDPGFCDFLERRLSTFGDTWMSCFLQVVNSAKYGTAAWHAYLDLRLQSQDAVLKRVVSRLDQLVQDRTTFDNVVASLEQIQARFRAQVEEVKHLLPRERNSLDLEVLTRLNSIEMHVSRIQQIGAVLSLDDAYIPPNGVFNRIDLTEFAGREWLISSIDDFLQKHDRGYFAIEGDAGTGKSTIAAWLVQQRGYISHFGELVHDSKGAEVALRNLCSQLISRYQIEPYFSRNSLPPSAHEPSTFSKLLGSAAENREDDDPIVLVVDALDEIQASIRMMLPQTLPRGIYIIVTYRPGSYSLVVDGASTHLQILKLEGAEQRNQDDIRVYLECATTWEPVTETLKLSGITRDRFVDSLARKSQGIWIYVYHVVHELRLGVRKFLNLDALPNGLARYYIEQVRSWRSDPVLQPWNERCLPILAALAAAQGPLSLEEIARFSHTTVSSDGLRQLIEEKFRPYLTLVQASPVHAPSTAPRYRFYHSSLVDFFHGLTKSSGWAAADSSLAAELERATLDAHRRIADYYLSKWRKARSDVRARESAETEYLLSHLCFHLAKANMLGALKDLLMAGEWIQAKYQYDISGFAYATDILQLNSILQEHGLTHLPEILAWNSLYATVASKASRLPLDVIEAIFWGDEPGLAYRIAALMTEPHARAQAFLKIGRGYLAQKQLDRAKYCFEIATDAALLSRNHITRNELITDVVGAHIDAGNYARAGAVAVETISQVDRIADICDRLRSVFYMRVADPNEAAAIIACLQTVSGKLKEMGRSFEYMCQQAVVFHLQGMTDHCRKLLTTVVLLLPSQPNDAKVEAARRLAPLLHQMGDVRQGLDLLSAGLAAARGQGTVPQQAAGLARLACTHCDLGLVPAARQVLEEALKLAENLDNERTVGIRLLEVVRALARAIQCAGEFEELPRLLRVAYPDAFFDDGFWDSIYADYLHRADAITHAVAASQNMSALHNVLDFAGQTRSLTCRTALLNSSLRALEAMAQPIDVEAIWTLAQTPLVRYRRTLLERLFESRSASRAEQQDESLFRSQLKVSGVLAANLARNGDTVGAMDFLRFSLPNDTAFETDMEDVNWRVSIALQLCDMNSVNSARDIAVDALALLDEMHKRPGNQTVSLGEDYQELLAKLFHVLHVASGFNRALKQFLRLATNDTANDRQIRGAIVQSLLHDGDYTALKRLARVRPPDLEFMCGAALGNQKMGDSATAIALANKVMARVARYNDTGIMLAGKQLLNLVKLYADLNCWESALDVVELLGRASVSAEKLQSQALSIVALAQAQAGRYDLALDTALGGAKDQEPQNIAHHLVDNVYGCDPVVVVSKVFVEKGLTAQIQRVEAVLPYILKADGTTAHGYDKIRIAMGIAYAERGELDKAKAIMMQEEHSSLPDQIRLAYIRHLACAGQFEEAVTFLDGVELIQSYISGAADLLKVPAVQGMKEQRKGIMARACSGALTSFDVNRELVRDEVADLAAALASAGDADETICLQWILSILAIAKTSGRLVYLSTASRLAALMARYCSLDQVWQEYAVIERLWEDHLASERHAVGLADRNF